MAKGLGAKRTITRVSKLSYMPVVSAIGLDTVINPRMAAVRAILQYIRRGRILSVAPLREEQAEAIEAEALETSDNVNTPLSGLTFPRVPFWGLSSGETRSSSPGVTRFVLPHDRLSSLHLQQVTKKIERS